MHALSIYVDLLMVSMSTWNGHQNSNKFESSQALNRLKSEPRANDVWQIKIVQTVLRRKRIEMLLSTEHLNSLLQLTESHMETVLDQRKRQLREFMYSSNVEFLKHLQPQLGALMQIASIIVFYDLPRNLLDATNNASQANYLQLLTALKKAKIGTNTIQTISRLLEMENGC